MGRRDRIIVSQEASEHAGQREAPSFAFRCGVQGDRLEALYTPGIHIPRPAEPWMRDNVYVGIRFGDASPTVGVWNPSSSRTATFSDDPRGLFERLLRVEKFVLEVRTAEAAIGASGLFSTAGMAELREILRPCLPELPDPEIFREMGVSVDRLDYKGGWHVVSRQRLDLGVGAGPSQSALVYYGHVHTDTGNQNRIALYCNGANLVVQVRIQMTPEFDGREVEISWPSGSTGSNREQFSRIRRINSRTWMHPDPRRFARQLSALPAGDNSFFTHTFSGGRGQQYRIESFGNLHIAPEQFEVIAPCMGSTVQQPSGQQRPRR